MGFMGIDHWIQSDKASIFLGQCIDAIEKLAAEEITKSYGPYNTPGCVNVALLLESRAIPLDRHNFELRDALLAELEKLHKDEELSSWFRSGVKRLIGSVTEYYDETS